MPLEPHPTAPDKLVFRSSGRLTPLCMCREPWALERVHREKTPCFDYVERKPLTEGEIAQAMFRAHAIVTGPMQFRFAKEIERAHGIGDSNAT